MGSAWGWRQGRSRIGDCAITAYTVLSRVYSQPRWGGLAVTRLTLERVSKRFGDQTVLDDISFKVESGEVLSLVGPSGCGKTTLLSLILGEHAPDEGHVLFDDESVEAIPIDKRGVGVVYQSYALFPHLTALDNVAYGPRVRGERRQAAHKAARDLLARVELADLADRYPYELSGGQKQRVALARALATKPRVLLLDEAFGALDATARGTLAADVRRVIKRFGVTTVLVTHDQEEAYAFGDRIAVMATGGRVVAIGTPEEVIERDDPFLREFLRTLSLSNLTVERDREGPFVRLAGGRILRLRLPHVEEGETLQLILKRAPADGTEG